MPLLPCRWVPVRESPGGDVSAWVCLEQVEYCQPQGWGWARADDEAQAAEECRRAALLALALAALGAIFRQGTRLQRETEGLV